MNKLSNILLVLFMSTAILSSCTKEEEEKYEASSSPQVTEVQPALASANNVITLSGSGLGQVASIIFGNDSVPATFNPVFNTDKTLIFRVPLDAIPGQQSIIITNTSGKTFTVPFKVLGLATIIDVSNYNFNEGGELTLTGKNLDDVKKVVMSATGPIAGSTNDVTIVSKTATQLVVKFPANSPNRAKLVITNEAGNAATTQEFVNMDKAFKFFTEGFDQGYQDAAWGQPGTVATNEFKSGTKSYGKTYDKGNWHQMGFGWNGTTNDNYKFFSFWIKGGSIAHDLWISTAASEGGFASFNDYAKITVPANVWTYFKLPIDPLKLWATGTSFNQIGFRIKGPDNQNERFYLDDVIFVK